MRVWGFQWGLVMQKRPMACTADFSFQPLQKVKLMARGPTSRFSGHSPGFEINS